MLWALEEIATSLGDRKIVRVAATFQKYLFVDTMATLVVKARTADRFKAEIRTAAGKAIRIDLNLREFDALEEPLEEHNTLHADVGTSRPNILGFADLDGASGTIAANATLAAESFPNLSANIGARAVSSMAALSAIVGMRCPGLHSIFGSFAVDIDDSASPLTYRATSTDARFSLVEINVSGAGLDGSISAFLRDEPAISSPAANSRTFVLLSSAHREDWELRPSPCFRPEGRTSSERIAFATRRSSDFRNRSTGSP